MTTFIKFTMEVHSTYHILRTVLVEYDEGLMNDTSCIYKRSSNITVRCSSSHDDVRSSLPVSIFSKHWLSDNNVL